MAYENTCVISCGRRSCSFFSVSNLNQGAVARAHVPHWGALRLIKGQACVRFVSSSGLFLGGCSSLYVCVCVCVGEGWVDAHHMGSYGPRASVGG